MKCLMARINRKDGHQNNIQITYVFLLKGFLSKHWHQHRLGVTNGLYHMWLYF